MQQLRISFQKWVVSLEAANYRPGVPCCCQQLETRLPPLPGALQVGRQLLASSSAAVGKGKVNRARLRAPPYYHHQPFSPTHHHHPHQRFPTHDQSQTSIILRIDKLSIKLPSLSPLPPPSKQHPRQQTSRRLSISLPFASRRTPHPLIPPPSHLPIFICDHARFRFLQLQPQCGAACPRRAPAEGDKHRYNHRWLYLRRRRCGEFGSNYLFIYLRFRTLTYCSFSPRLLPIPVPRPVPLLPTRTARSCTTLLPRFGVPVPVPPPIPSSRPPSSRPSSSCTLCRPAANPVSSPA